PEGELGLGRGAIALAVGLLADPGPAGRCPADLHHVPELLFELPGGVLGARKPPRARDQQHAQEGPDPHRHSWPPCAVRSSGNRITSRIETQPVRSITSRSTPRPRPPAGGMPMRSAWMKSSSSVRTVRSSSLA